jgi:hypothetical protein
VRAARTYSNDTKKVTAGSTLPAPRECLSNATKRIIRPSFFPTTFVLSIQYLFCEAVGFEATIQIHAVNFFGTLIYLLDMTKLLEEAVSRLRQLPAPMQDSAARVMLMQLEEEPEPGDLAAITEGRRAYERGQFVSLDQLRRDMGIWK